MEGISHVQTYREPVSDTHIIKKLQTNRKTKQIGALVPLTFYSHIIESTF